MYFIHQSSAWPHFTWDDAHITPLLAAIRHEQGKLLGRMESVGFKLCTDATLSILTLEVVKSSAIEGEILNPGEVRSSIARRLGLDAAGLPNPGRAVEGIVEIMIDATRNFEIPLSKDRIFSWHAALFPTGRSGMTKITVGAWRPFEAGPMQVISDPFGKEQIHFEAPDGARLEWEINRFLEWFDESTALDPVLKAAIAHFWFVTIHPFEDGNGRIARAIADMALARGDGTGHRFYSMSSQIEAERQVYYHELERAQRGDLNITTWILWFLQCLGRAIANSDTILRGVVFKAKLWQRLNERPVNDRQRKVINKLLDGFEGFLTSSKYAAIAKCSPDSALRDIRELLAWGVLLQNYPGGRSTSYRLPEL